MPELLAGVDPVALIVTPLVIAFAYTVFGVSGFGSTAIAVPLLAHFLPLTFSVPLMVLLDLVAAGIAGRSNEHVDMPEMKRVLPWLALGIVLGATLLVHAPPQPLKYALGIFALAMGLHGVASAAAPRRIAAAWAIPAGVVGGAVAAVFGAGGPIYATYFAGRLDDKTVLRSTVARMISISALVRTIVYAIGGLVLHAALLASAAALAPFVWLGLRTGMKIHVGLTQSQMRRVVGALLVVSGAVLLGRTWLER